VGSEQVCAVLITFRIVEA